MKSLQEAYKNVYASNEKINEAKISFEFEDQPPRFFSLKDTYAKQLLNQTQNYAFDLKSKILQWINVSGWNSKEAKRTIPNRVLNIINEYIDITDDTVAQTVVTAIEKIIQNKDSLRNFEKNLNAKNQDFFGFFKNILTEIPETQIFNQPVILESLVNNLVFPEGNVGVGAGEVFITLFSEAKNPAKGDLELADGSEVELKADGGRAGKKSATAAVKGMKTILSSLKSVNDSRKERIKSQIFQNFSELQQSLDSALELLQNKEVNIARSHNRHYKNKFLWAKETIKNAGSSFDNVDLSKNKWDDLYNKLEQVGVPIPESDIRYLFITYYSISEDKAATSNFKLYFDAILENRTDENIYMATSAISEFADEKLQEKEKSLIFNTIKQRSDLNGADLASKIVASIQIADYYKTENFKYLVFFAPRKGYKQLVMGPFVDNYSSNFKLAIDNIDKIQVDPSTGGTGPLGAGGRQGFNILLK